MAIRVAPDVYRVTEGRLAAYLGIAGVALELVVSANLLTWAGVPYVSDGGNLLVKLHPGTYAIALGFAALLAGREAWKRLLTDGMLACALAGMIACLFAMLLLTGTGHAVVLLDTFLPACMLAIVLQHATSGQRDFLRRAMQALLVANAMLALAEVAAQATVFPLYLNDSAYHPHTEDFRPTALFDHPLTGAVLTMMGLALCPKAGSSRARLRRSHVGSAPGFRRPDCTGREPADRSGESGASPRVSRAVA